MAFRSILWRVLAVTALLANPVQAQNKPSDPDLMKRQLEQYLKAHPNVPRKAEGYKDGRIAIPDTVLEQLEYDFERQYAMTGHGLVYDARGRVVKIDADMARELQEQMLKVLEGPEQRYMKIDSRAAELLEALRAERRQLRGTVEQMVANYHLIRLYAVLLPRDRRDRFIWRARISVTVPDLKLEVVKLNPDLIQAVLELFNNRAANAISYRAQCDAEDVIIPQTFNINDAIWTYQGDLSTNMLAPGDAAQVYTYASPNHRGGCVALPRGTGVSGSNDVAGFICQSATTGAACFWDNIETDPQTGVERTIPWAEETIRIDNISNATTLPNCTGCHKGNNVFLVAPDDPTWCRLLRGATSSDCAAMSGPNASNFTLQVDAGINPVLLPGTNPPLFHPSYTPLSGTPPRPNWVNGAQPGCGASCHLGPSINPGNLVMPPNCGFACNN